MLIGALPCGTVVLWDELFGSEGIRQVHGITAEYLSNLDEKALLKVLGYDDACHFAKHSRYRNMTLTSPKKYSYRPDFGVTIGGLGVISGYWWVILGLI